jgi:hypothetical protein
MTLLASIERQKSSLHLAIQHDHSRLMEIMSVDFQLLRNDVGPIAEDITGLSIQQGRTFLVHRKEPSTALSCFGKQYYALRRTPPSRNNLMAFVRSELLGEAAANIL